VNVFFSFSDLFHWNAKMVQIHVKQSEERQFLYECPATQSVDMIIRDVASIHNLQMRIQYLYIEGEQLSLYGPAKPDDNGERPDTEEEDASSSSKIRGPFHNKDHSGKRTGDACNPKCAETLRRILSEAEAYVSKNQVLQKIPLELDILEDHILNIKGAVVICYPMGLPNYDPVQQLLSGTFKGEETFDPDTAQLWWAGKELMRNKKLCDHAGKNEKTKIIAKLRARGHGPPLREPKLDDDEDGLYMNSSWAKPKSTKSQFQGLSVIRYG
jgi:hypothetical protein